MKKISVIFCLILCLLISSCSSQTLPETAADGTPWSEDWTSLGTVLGVEPMEGWTAQRNEDILAAEGMFFATWSYGEPTQNSDGDTVYSAQIFLVVSECESAQAVETCLADWQALVGEHYLTEEPQTIDSASGSYTLIPYRFPDATGNFTKGISALGSFGNYAINAELSCRDDFPLDIRETLTVFLENLHYAN